MIAVAFGNTAKNVLIHSVMLCAMIVSIECMKMRIVNENLCLYSMWS